MRTSILTILTTLTSVLVLTLGAAAALADYAYPQQQNELAIRLGAFFPPGGEAQRFGGATEFLGGLDYTMSATGGKSPSATGLYLDYNAGSQRSGYIHSGGLGFQFRAMWPTYIGAGLGLYNTAARTPNGEASGNTTGLGGKVFLGTQIGNRAMIQLDYHVAPQALGVSANGPALEFGFRL